MPRANVKKFNEMSRKGNKTENAKNTNVKQER